MTAADKRVEYARDFLASARKRRVAELPPSVLAREDAELRRVLGQVLALLEDEERARDVLAAIRAVLAAFDWERDDRQYALEEIDRIAGGAR